MSMLGEFSRCFTRPGQRRFAALVSGALLSERRPLVTEIVTALGLQDHWRAVEAFVEEGSWPLEEVERKLAKLAAGSGGWRGRPIDCAQGREPVERQLWAVDDLKVLKSGKKIWGACSFHEYTSRSSNRPETVWAHNWVVCGALKLGPAQKAFLPTSARLYARREQMPPGESFRAKTELAVELLRNCARGVEGRHLAVFDGAYAVSTTVQLLIHPCDLEPRIDFLSRLRFDSRLYEPPLARQEGRRGRPRRWGSPPCRRLETPTDGRATGGGQRPSYTDERAAYATRRSCANGTPLAPKRACTPLPSGSTATRGPGIWSPATLTSRRRMWWNSMPRASRRRTATGT